MNTIKNKRIAIVGGGPGGLTLARLLQMKGVGVTIYERDASKDARPQGATLDLHDESGLMALRAAGLMDAFKANYRPFADRLRIMDKDANILLDEHVNKNNDMGRPEIDRGPLQRILLESLHPGTVVWGSQFVSLLQYDGKWLLTFKDGTTAAADIVVAADGANSRIRPYITDIKPFYAGVTAIEGTVYNAEQAIPELHDLVHGGKIFALGNEQSLIVSSKGDGSQVFYASFKTGEQWHKDGSINFADKAQVLDWFKKNFAGWNTIWHQLFEQAQSQFIPRPIYCMPPSQSWAAQPALTMLGDAAHLMPPFAGEGVNMAMQDALELSQHLTSSDHPDTHTAIAAYEEQMRTRAAEAARQSLESTEVLHSVGALQFMIGVMRGGGE